MPDIAGLKLIVPTSVAGSGVSVSASGKVTFTAATSVSVNGCFGSNHDNYLIVVRNSLSGSADTNMRLRLSGTDATGSNYTYQYVIASGTSVTGGRATTTGFILGGGGTNNGGEHIYLYGPNLAQATAVRNISANGVGGGTIQDIANTHSLATAYDGFTYYVNTGTITGILTIYGLAN